MTRDDPAHGPTPVAKLGGEAVDVRHDSPAVGGLPGEERHDVYDDERRAACALLERRAAVAAWIQPLVRVAAAAPRLLSLDLARLDEPADGGGAHTTKRLFRTGNGALTCGGATGTRTPAPGCRVRHTLSYDR